MIRFIPHHGDLMGLTTNENHLVFRWLEDGCRVLFSVARHGRAASCHLASDKASLRFLRRAINDFAEFVFYLFDWCRVIMVATEGSRFERILFDCGFSELAGNDSDSVYMRPCNG